MSYELGTLYQQSTNTDDDFARAWDVFGDKGAVSGAALRAINGPFTGSLYMGSQWDSLDTMTDWLASMRPRMLPGGDLHDIASRSGTLVARIVGTEVASVGTHEGAYVIAARATASEWSDEGFEIGAGHLTAAGCNGARALQVSMGGDWIGQYLVQISTDSLDAYMAGRAAAQADSSWTSKVEAVGWATVSATGFETVSRM